MTDDNPDVAGQRPVGYEVTLEVAPELVEAVLRELVERHIPDILATGCFAAIRLERAGGRIRTRYEAAHRADLDRYLAEHTARFRTDFMARFPAGVRPAREVWQGVGEWRRDAVR